MGGHLVAQFSCTQFPSAHFQYSPGSNLRSKPETYAAEPRVYVTKMKPTISQCGILVAAENLEHPSPLLLKTLVLKSQTVQLSLN